MVDNNLDTEKQSNAKLCIICMDEHNGILDQHPCSVCSKDSWFWPYLKKDLNYYSIEVYTDDFSVLKKQKLLLEKMLRS